MLQLTKFYYHKNKRYFYSGLLVIVVSYLAKWILELLIPDFQGDRVPYLISVITAIVLTWKINSFDTDKQHKTLASTVSMKGYQRLASKFILSYLEVLGVFLLNSLFNLFTLELSILDGLVMGGELAVYMGAFISYGILLKATIQKLKTDYFPQTLLMVVGIVLIILLNGLVRCYFPDSSQFQLVLNSGVFYPSTFSLNFVLSSGIAGIYLGKNQI
ncbi:hypothetical protein ACWOFR_15280 [Carnobacterium gallinarum]|uniref:hypothetical protein n=1 Tax=Carnobacterium gallinarum TaxID=2749 RepID=UPI00055916B0|nr:hypothetical protein [Carnobacterium gallinarum]